jgi:DNA helicase HerA-like ATPase
MLEASGAPAIVTRALIVPPTSRVGPITAAELAEVQDSSPFKGKYDIAIDRDSAFEMLQARTQQHASGAAVDASQDGGLLSQIGSGLQGLFHPKGRRMSIGEAAMRSAATSVTRDVTNAVTKAILRNLTGGMK